ncbi:arginyltransferase [bacterium]|nr:arginyltransferase [bacterium]
MYFAPMELELFEANNGECPYLDNRQWRSYTFRAGSLENSVYEALISYGFRRSGCFFYKNNCPDCLECVSIRLKVNDVILSKSQRRAWNKNQDISLTWHPVKFDQESFELYKKYSVEKHGAVTSEKNYKDFLVHSAVDTIMMRYYLDQRLIGVGWVDVLVNSLSSVYFAYDLDFHKRRLGIFSFLKELELAKQLKKKFLHLGFWVRDCKAMSYKQQFRPYELLIDGIWVNHPNDMN